MKINGINQEIFELILSVFKKFNKIEKVILFGSRAKGNFIEQSDIDLAILGVDNSLLIEEIRDSLEELPTPYKFDLKDYSKINNIKLKEHIDRVGIQIYIRTN